MDAEIDSIKVLKEIHPSIISEYLEHFYGYRVEDDWSKRYYKYEHVAEDFWHGEFDIKKFLKAIGPSGVERVKEVLNE